MQVLNRFVALLSLGFVVTASLGSLAQASPALEAEISPVADLACSLSVKERAQRLGFLSDEIRSIHAGISQVEQEQKKLRDAVVRMEGSYQFSRNARLMTEVVGLFMGYGSIKAAYQAKEVIQFAGGIVPMIMGQSVTLHMLFKSAELIEGKLDGEFTYRLTQLLSKPFSIDSGREFLTQPKCSIHTCPITSPDVEALHVDLKKWHTNALKEHAAKKPWVLFEFFHKSYGNQVANIDLPYSSGVLTVMKARAAYLELLQLAMVQDQAACIYRSK